MDILFIIMNALIVLFTGYYLVIHFKYLPYISRFKKPWVTLLLSVMLAGLCLYLVYLIFGFSIIIILFLIYSFLITDIINLIIKKFIKSKSVRKIWIKLYHSSILAFIFMFIISTGSYYTATHVVITRYNLYTDKSPGQQNLKILMISDLHFGTTMNADKLAKYCKQVDTFKPDLVVLDGDMFDENTKKGYMEAACQLLGQIKSTYGVFYVFGNHDARSYRSNAYFTKKDIITNLNCSKIVVLDDEVKLINNKFYIIGRKDASFSRRALRKTLPELLKGTDKKKFIILLDHQPLDLQKASEYGIDLQLSGHTHGGQIWPSGLISQLFHINELTYGYKKINNYQIIVSSGMGAWSYPLRLGSKSEIVQIQLHSK